MNPAVQVRVIFQPSGRSTHIDLESTVWEAAKRAGVSLRSVCGGQGTCGKCRIRLVSGVLGPLTLAEQQHLTSGEREQGYRLACQAIIKDTSVIDASYQVAHDGFKVALPALSDEIKVNSGVRKVYIEMPCPSLLDNRPHIQRLKDTLTTLGYSFQTQALATLQELPASVQAQDFKVTCTLDGSHLINVEAGNTTPHNYGIAIDLGTTTIAAYLVNLTTGVRLATASAINRQAIYGADVISRITYAMQYGPGELRTSARDVINELICRVTDQAGVARRHIYAVTMVGNTCMLHIFLGVNPMHLGVAPYVSVFHEMKGLRAVELGLGLNPEAMVYILPTIGAYVGADAVACVLASGLHKSDKVKLIIDVGTNAEVILGSRQRIMACSAAAGPAFEGARIRHGMQAASGAINQVCVDSAIRVRTIDDAPPVGITGVGLVSAVAALLRRGMLDRQGLFQHQNRVSPDYWISGDNGPELLLSQILSGSIRRHITLSPRDVSELQLAKAAIQTAIKMLLRNMSLSVSDISQVLLAGSFGNYMNPEDALTIGLIPVIPLERVENLGNAAGTGALMALLSTQKRREARKIVRQIEYMELSIQPDFNKYFVDSLPFGSVNWSRI